MQRSIYFDDSLLNEVEQHAKKEGISFSKWVSKIIKAELEKRKQQREWPQEFLDTLGSCPDFPLAKELRSNIGVDKRVLL